MEIESTPEMWLEADGELLEEGATTVEVAPGARRVVVGLGKHRAC